MGIYKEKSKNKNEIRNKNRNKKRMSSRMRKEKGRKTRYLRRCGRFSNNGHFVIVTVRLLSVGNVLSSLLERNGKSTESLTVV